ncbi:MAG TPA: hypothetical protein VIL13_00345 [Longimicrobiales bacterium]
MDWVRLHLVVNHFPVILIMAGSLAAITALLSRFPGVWRYAYVTVLLAALTSPVAYVTGLMAEEPVEDAWFVEHSEVEEHEETGLYALVALLAAGVTAAIAWWRPKRATNGLFLVVTLLAAIATGYAALEGGEIVHDSPALLHGPGAQPAPSGGPPGR